MHVEHHPLMNDFPELRETLHELRQSDNHFARVAGEYEELDKRICRVEDGIDMLDEDSLNALKVQRVGLKDDVARMLSEAKSTCCGGCGG
jgi:hypothetical protein